MDINLDTKKPLFSDAILNKLRYEHTHGGGMTTEYHPTDDIAALFKTRDLVLIRTEEPKIGYKKKVVSWKKKTNAEINNLLTEQEWRQYL